MPAEPSNRTSIWSDTAVFAALLLTLVVSLARLAAGMVTREPFGAEMSFALLFALLTVAALSSEVTFRVRRRRSRASR
jgi:hypothetical protein